MFLNWKLTDCAIMSLMVILTGIFWLFALLYSFIYWLSTHLFLMSPPWSGEAYDFHFTAEETEAQISSVIRPRSRSWDSNPRNLAWPSITLQHASPDGVFGGGYVFPLICSDTAKCCSWEFSFLSSKASFSLDFLPLGSSPLSVRVFVVTLLVLHSPHRVCVHVYVCLRGVCVCCGRWLWAGGGGEAKKK